MQIGNNCFKFKVENFILVKAKSVKGVPKFWVSPKCFGVKGRAGQRAGTRIVALRSPQERGKPWRLWQARDPRGTCPIQGAGRSADGPDTPFLLYTLTLHLHCIQLAALLPVPGTSPSEMPKNPGCLRPGRCLEQPQPLPGQGPRSSDFNCKDERHNQRAQWGLDSESWDLKGFTRASNEAWGTLPRCPSNFF